MMSNPIEIEIEAIYDDLIFCEILSIVFEVHRAVKKGMTAWFGFLVVLWTFFRLFISAGSSRKFKIK